MRRIIRGKWFYDGKRYTIMGVADVNGFVQSACVCFRRDELFDDPHGGASGTLNKQVFIDRLILKILLLLGNFEKGEPRSIVFLDNASIHIDEEIVSLIQSKGACILYNAAFSPDINPIEKMFVIYKAFLHDPLWVRRGGFGYLVLLVVASRGCLCLPSDWLWLAPCVV
jgi:transposase